MRKLLLTQNFEAKNTRHQARGIAILEIVIIIPLLVFLFTAIYDLGSVLNTYLRLTSVVHQGVRMATRVNNLDTGDFSGLSSGQACQNVSPPSKTHSSIQNRVEKLILLLQQRLPITSYCIDSGRVFIVPGSIDPLHNTVYVRINITFRGFFPGFRNLQISTIARAPYLS